MRIWNKEINNCGECSSLFSHGDAYDQNCELIEHSKSNSFLELKLRDDNAFIHENCPFKAKITREIIEGFGFKSDGGNINYYEHNDDSTSIHVFPSGEFVIKHGFADLMFELKNPQELEFILKTLNIIK